MFDGRAVGNVRRIVAACIAAVLVSAWLVPAAGAAGPITQIAAFEETVAPEGIAVAADGTVYISTAGGGQVWSLDAAGAPTVVATIDPAVSPAGVGVLGLWLDGDMLYAAAATANPDTGGVWAIDLANGNAMTRVPGSEAAGFPNAVVTVGEDIYFTDSNLGAVWRQSGSDPAAVWAMDPALEGTGALTGPDNPIGANGIAARGATILVANTEKGSVVSIPIEADGSAGAIAEHSDAQLVGVDGIAVDGDGAVYAVIVAGSALLRIETDGSITRLGGPEDGLDAPSSVAVGPDGLIYVVNFSIGELFGVVGGAGPGVVVFDPAFMVADRDIVAYGSGDQEVPGTSSSAWSWSVFRLRDNGRSLSFSTTVFDIESPIVAAHLHLGASGSNGGVVVNLTDAIVDDTRLAGDIDLARFAGSLSEGSISDLIAEIDAGNIYLNIHTAQNPGGEIRAQLVR